MPSSYRTLRYFYRGLFFLTLVFSLLLILSAIVYFFALPSSLLFLGLIVSSIPFLSPAWIILTLTTVLLLGIAASAFIHRRQLNVEEHSFLNEKIELKKNLLETTLDEIKTKADLTIEKLAKLSEQIEKAGQQKTYFLQAIKHITLEVNLIKKKSYKIEIKKHNYIDNEASVNSMQEYLDKFQKLAKELSFKMCIIEAKRERLELEFKRMEAQYSEQNRPKAIVSAAPHSGSLLFKVTADIHHQENTGLALEERLQTSNGGTVFN